MSATDRSGLDPLPPAVTRSVSLAGAEPGESMLPPFLAGEPAAAIAPSPVPVAPEVDLEALGAVPVDAEEETFPLDAFIIPEDARRVPAGIESGSTPAAASDPAVVVAERLERIARRLREGGAAAMRGLASSDDRLDAVIAGVITGYLAARDA